MSNQTYMPLHNSAHYGKAEYWEKRYSKYSKIINFEETQSLLIGTKFLKESKT